MKWRMQETSARPEKPYGITIYADIYEGDVLVAERIKFTEATKVVQRHNAIVAKLLT